MEGLITITEKDGKQLVSARELHRFLENPDNVNTWFKRQCEYGFEEGKDFIAVSQESTGGRPSIDYALTLDCAKEISMIQRTEKGKQARRYFIDCEKKLKEVSTPNYESALAIIGVDESLIPQIAKVYYERDEMKPKVIAFENVIDSQTTYTLDSVSDILNIGRTTLSKILESKKWKTVREVNGTSSTRYSEENGYAKTIFEYINIGNKEIKSKRIVLKKKGLDKLIKELNNGKNIN